MFCIYILDIYIYCAIKQCVSCVGCGNGNTMCWYSYVVRCVCVCERGKLSFLSLIIQPSYCVTVTIPCGSVCVYNCFCGLYTIILYNIVARYYIKTYMYYVLRIDLFNITTVYSARHVQYFFFLSRKLCLRTLAAHTDWCCTHQIIYA